MASLSPTLKDGNAVWLAAFDATSFQPDGYWWINS